MVDGARQPSACIENASGTSPTLVLHYITTYQHRPPVENLNAINPELRKESTSSRDC